MQEQQRVPPWAPTPRFRPAGALGRAVVAVAAVWLLLAVTTAHTRWSAARSPVLG